MINKELPELPPVNCARCGKYEWAYKPDLSGVYCSYCVPYIEILKKTIYNELGIRKPQNVN